MVGGGGPFYLKLWVNRTPLEPIADYEPSLVAPQS